MAKLIRVSDELYDYIQGMSRDGESLGNTIQRLMDVEQNKGRIERQYSHREELMPRAVYNFTILQNFVNEDGEYEKKSSTQLSNRLKGLIADNSLMERYPADEKQVSDRPRWQVRFSTALRQLKKENYIKQDEEPGPIYQEGRISKRDVYSLTEEGKSLVNRYQLFIDSSNCYIARRTDDISPPKQALQGELPPVLRSVQGQKSGRVEASS